MWLLLVVVFLTLGTTSQLLRRVIAQKHPEYARLLSAIFFICFLLPGGALYALFFPHDLNIGLTNLVLIFFGSMIFPLGGIFSMRANQHTDVGIFTLICSISPVLTLAIAIPFMHETLSEAQGIGIALLIFAAIIAAAAELRKNVRADGQGILFSFLAATTLGFGIAFERYMLGQMDFGAYIIYGWGFQILWATFFARKDFRHIPRLLAQDAREGGRVIAWGFINTLKAMAFVPALALSGAAVMSGANNFLAVAVVIAAYFVLGEREHMAFKWTATALGIVGLFLIAH